MFASFLAIVCKSENCVSVRVSIPTKLDDSAVSTLKHLCFTLETLSANGSEKILTFFSQFDQTLPFVHTVEVAVLVAKLR